MKRAALGPVNTSASKQARQFGKLVLESRDDWPVERGLDRHNLELYNRKKP